MALALYKPVRLFDFPFDKLIGRTLSRQLISSYIFQIYMLHIVYVRHCSVCLSIFVFVN